jgi:hypothetical protein
MYGTLANLEAAFDPSDLFVRGLTAAVALAQQGVCPTVHPRSLEMHSSPEARYFAIFTEGKC